MKQKKRFFITGTDTEIGKTTIACKLLKEFAKQGYSTLGLKPVATGCYQTPEGLRNTDTDQLKAASTIKLPYDQINPIRLLDPTSPDIASAPHYYSVKQVMEKLEPAFHAKAECLIVEGLGGWHVPLNPFETMADFAKKLNFPIIIVVGIRLGCINHALLTFESIQKSGAPIAGWIANYPDRHYQYTRATIQTIQQHAPLVPFLEHAEFSCWSQESTN